MEWLDAINNLNSVLVKNGFDPINQLLVSRENLFRMVSDHISDTKTSPKWLKVTDAENVTRRLADGMVINTQFGPVQIINDRVFLEDMTE